MFTCIWVLVLDDCLAHLFTLFFVFFQLLLPVLLPRLIRRVHVLATLGGRRLPITTHIGSKTKWY